MISQRPPTIANAATVAATYLLVGAAVVAAQPESGVALWYPPVGVGMAAMALYGYRMAAIVLLCDFLVTGFQYELGIGGALIIAAATTVECLTFYRCHRWLVGRFRELTFQVYFRYFLAIVFATLAGAVLGTEALDFFGQPVGRAAYEQVASWWVGDLTGALALVTAALCLFDERLDEDWRTWFGAKALLKLSIVVLSVSAILVVAIVSSYVPVAQNRGPHLHLVFGVMFLAIIPVAYAAASFGLRITALLIVYVSAFQSLVLFSSERLAVSAFDLLQPSMISFQLHLITVTLVSIGVAMAIAGEQRALRFARKSYMQLLHVARRNTAGEMAATMAHELGQPLAAIEYAAHALARRGRQGLDSAEARKAIAQIAASGEQARAIVDRLRGFVGRGRGEAAPTDVNACVREAVELLAEDARRGEVAVALDLAEESPIAKVDQVQIQQVLVNLLRNAFDAVAERPVGARRVTARTSMVGDDVVEIAVEDNGGGLPPGGEERAFESYYTTKHDGLGMGLAIARSIVRDHGGELEAKTRTGAGAAFTFTLPGAWCAEDDRS